VSELIANNRDKWLMVAEEIELEEERGKSSSHFSKLKKRKGSFLWHHRGKLLSAGKNADR
jgi:hypothetical protein